MAAPSPSVAAQTATAVPSSTSRPWARTPPAPQPASCSGASASPTPSASPRERQGASPPRTRSRCRGARRRAPRPPPWPPRSPRPADRGACERPAPTLTDITPHDTGPMAALPLIALFGPTGVGKTDVPSRWPRSCARAARIRGRLRRRAAGLRGLEIAHRRGRAPASAPCSSIACSASCRSTRRFSVAQYAELAHAEIDGLLASGRRPIVVGGHGPVPARRARRARPAPAAARGRARALEAELERGARRRCTPARAPRAVGGRGDRAHRLPPDRARARAARRRRARAARDERHAAVDRGHAPSDAARRA